MSSIILRPDEELQNPHANNQDLDAIYTFNPDAAQRDNLRRLYKGNPNANLQLQMQFLQSSNQLEAADTYIEIKLNSGAFEKIYISGTFYSISEFIDWLLPYLTASISGDVWEVEQDILQNQGLFNLRLKTYAQNVEMIFHGYRLCQMLGLTHEVEDSVTWTYTDTGTIVALMHYFMGVVKVYNVECTLQKKDNLIYDERSVRHTVIGFYVNSVQSGDYCSIVANIPLGTVELDDLMSFQIKLWDQNFYICKWVDEFKLRITFQSEKQDISKIISNKSQ